MRGGHWSSSSILTCAVTLAAAVAITVGLAACAPRVNAARVSPVRYAPVPADSVYVFTSVSRVTVPYEEVAILDGSMGSSGLDADMIDEMRKKAGSLGANGLILGDITHPSDNAVAATAIASAVLRAPGSIDIRTRARAVAVRLRGPARR
ncbi:MAG: hypothetical protein ABI194_02940 [Gemmatimonadaceae bacterium]